MQSTTSPKPVVSSHEAKHELQNLSTVNHRGRTSSTVTTQSCRDRGSSVQPSQIVQSEENSKYTEQEPGWKTVNYNKRKPRSHTIVGTGTLGAADVVCHLKAVPSLVILPCIQLDARYIRRRTSRIPEEYVLGSHLRAA
nr:unnamed protein product [Callosobruchus chinensis]